MRVKRFGATERHTPRSRSGLFALKELLLLLICLATFVWLMPQWILWSVAAPGSSKRLADACRQGGVNRISISHSARHLWIHRPRHGVQLLNLATGKVEEHLPLTGGEVADAKHSRDGLTSMVIFCDGSCELFQMGDRPHLLQWPGALENRAAPVNADVSSDGSLALVFMQNGTVHGWSRQGLSWQPFTYSISTGANLVMASMDWSGKRVLAAYADRSLACYDATSGALEIQYSKLPEVCTTGAWSDDGETAAVGCFGGAIYLLDASRGTPVATLAMVKNPPFDHARVMAVAISPDGRHLAASSDFSPHICVWDLRSREASMRQLTGHAGLVRSVDFTPDSESLYSGSWDGTIREWSLADYSQRRSIE